MRAGSRNPIGESGVSAVLSPSSINACFAGSRVPFSVLTRRSTGAGSSSAAISVSSEAPNNAVRLGVSHSGNSLRTQVGMPRWISSNPSSDFDQRALVAG